ncbi:MAG: phosphoribosylglycinamide formyltransferase [Spirochaetia bacterium]|jgi:phosphoribosylglycinamide formyltransferase-1|nr:phosphoribosylglycinamide formyltransferase [Spirochaetia bacterium]
MARLAVFTSGNGSNFQAIAERIAGTEHTLACMICDRKNAHSFERAKNLGIKSYYIPYSGRSREEAESDIIYVLESEKIDLVSLAGFMRILTCPFVSKYKGRIINIHPALLPKFPGAHGIAESFASKERELGITIHYVDCGVDTGAIILQKSFNRDFSETIEEIEKKIHKLEYSFYPEAVEKLLDAL